jgi:transposase InsO family protein
MPWKEICALDTRKEMIDDWLTKEYTITELSESYDVSRKTVYKWIDRYHQNGITGLVDLSRRPDYHPNATSIDKVAVILALKRQKIRWGPRKIMAKLRSDQPEIKWPADSTGSSILKKHGLVQPRRRRRHVPSYTTPFINCDQPNAVWSADYKGQFKMGNSQKCYPLTISDNYSRCLLGCWGLTHPNFEQTKPCFETAFLRYGLPLAIRTDNGHPFASNGVAGLSRLSVWFIKLGIVPERIAPGCPEQNGRHERMHRTLKDATANPPKSHLEEQQKAFDAFIEEYNNERPHEALNQIFPASVYRSSPRPYPTKLPKIEYDSRAVLRHVTNRGCIKWKGIYVFLSESLIGEYVELKQIEDRLWKVFFCTYPLGILDEKRWEMLRLKV